MASYAQDTLAMTATLFDKNTAPEIELKYSDNVNDALEFPRVEPNEDTRRKTPDIPCTEEDIPGFLTMEDLVEAGVEVKRYAKDLLKHRGRFDVRPTQGLEQCQITGRVDVQEHAAPVVQEEEMEFRAAYDMRTYTRLLCTRFPMLELCESDLYSYRLAECANATNPFQTSFKAKEEFFEAKRKIEAKRMLKLQAMKSRVGYTPTANHLSAAANRPLMVELLKRTDDNLSMKTLTIIQLQLVDNKKHKISFMVDFRDRLRRGLLVPYFEGNQPRIVPIPSIDLSFCDLFSFKSKINDTENFQHINELSSMGLSLRCVQDNAKVVLEVDRPCENATAHFIEDPDYECAVLYDHATAYRKMAKHRYCVPRPSLLKARVWPPSIYFYDKTLFSYDARCHI